MSLLPCPEHHIHLPGKIQSRDRKVARNAFPSLNLDIISCDDISKHRLDFNGRKESAGANRQMITDSVNDHQTASRNTYQMCRPIPKAKCSLDVDTV